MNKRICVVGAGAAGLIAGAYAAKNGCTTEIFDGNEKAGKKLFLTGKGRCNLTNAASLDEFMRNIPHGGRFLYGAFGRFFNDDIIEILSSCGVPVKLERGGRYFPESDKSSDVIRALIRFCEKNGAKIHLNSRVTGIEYGAGKFVVYINGQLVRSFDRVILATGGASYPSTGSTGDGCRFARSLGHTVTAFRPSLVPLVTVEDWPRGLMGLSLKNVVLKAYARDGAECVCQNRKDTGGGGVSKISKNDQSLFKGAVQGKGDNNTKNTIIKRRRPVYEELGEMLFTHFGVSGPLVLSASSYLADAPAGATLELDLKPALSHETLDARVLRDFEKYKHKQIINAMNDLLPQRLINTLLKLADVPLDAPVDCLTREKRLSIVNTMKCMRLTVKCTRPLEEAIISRGGVALREVDPSTMESKLVPGLYFAGELLDVDACTGGFNLQIAWSTGAVAGEAAALN